MKQDCLPHLFVYPLTLPESPMHPNRKSWQQACGFTLVELLVVIAILALLAAIAFPVFGSMREKSHLATCLSNLRQIGTAVMQYAADHNGSLPPNVTSDDPSAGGHSLTYPQLIAPYMGQPEGGTLQSTVFCCPAADKNRPAWEGVGFRPDYGANERRQEGPGRIGVFARQAWGANVPALKMAMIRQPARCLMVADACLASGVKSGDWLLNLPALSGTSAAVPPSKLGPRHGYDGTNSLSGSFGALFCDGHVEMIRYDDKRLTDTALRRDFLVPY